MPMWILYGCFIVTFFYLLTVTNIFETNKSVYDFIRKTSRGKYPRRYDHQPPAQGGLNETTYSTQDIFDSCPFVPPDPWDPEILNYIDVKYGFFNNCNVNQKWSPITELRNGHVRILRAGSQRKYECRARCVNYLDEEHVSFDPWRDINDPLPFLCDFVHTECTSRKRTISHVHMQIAELRALPRTVNFLTNAMDAVQFRKLNKIGYNSRPNGFVMLFGKTTEAVTRELVDGDPIPADWTYSTYCRKYLDESIYVPIQYRNAGYKTFGAQDYSASLLNFPNCVGLENREFQHSYRFTSRTTHRDFQAIRFIGDDGQKVEDST
ncbi:hypothetical protein TELCIR_01650 [Teladorsagia circumcincta]|uniref:Uncharacterized protein n=1 Tax=Teladorsagia circumcincta TaxID=45464 RepID=A0A2G9V1K7_TELCI|nr:hypothetical protein TELCIR_01650 [Teladorsagia circumcincta]